MNEERLTDNNEVDILGEHLAPLDAPQCGIAVVLLSWRLVEKFVEKQEREYIRVIEEIVRSARQTLYDEVCEVRVGGAR